MATRPIAALPAIGPSARAPYHFTMVPSRRINITFPSQNSAIKISSASRSWRFSSFPASPAPFLSVSALPA